MSRTYKYLYTDGLARINCYVRCVVFVIFLSMEIGIGSPPKLRTLYSGSNNKQKAGRVPIKTGCSTKLAIQ